MISVQAKSIHITGVVQGVGFRPFVHNLAQRCGLSGWVLNTSAGVDIHVEGQPAQLAAFLDALCAEAPPLAHIDRLESADCAVEGYVDFQIRTSTAIPGAFQPISPDVAICPDCQRELRDPADRRHRYPFINCTHCGPRFTIITDIPYDRPLTTMARFSMCPACASEYHDPADRRFHAQPIACPECGPHIWLETAEGQVVGDAALERTVDLLRRGQIVAIKGLGGFHLACDATDADAVARLRARKGRAAKPFALMMPSLDVVRQHCVVTDAEARLLESSASPIVLLSRRADSQIIASDVAPGQNTLGVMLPYTPLHILLFDAGLPPLVMTSANHSEEPIVTDNDEARRLLADLADAFLMHDRDIYIRTDDSVVRIFEDQELPIRRSRGYAPYPVHLPAALPPILSVGGEIKNTFCVTRDTYAFMSHHIGDLENYATLRSFEAGIAHFERLFRIAPVVIAHDLHPAYRSTRYAERRSEADGIPRVGVQHHHAHIAAVLAEHGHPGDRPVIGVCFDGTGYGTDGTIWGGEFLIANYETFERAAWLRPVPLPGGDAAARRTARMALSYLIAAGLDADVPDALRTALEPTEERTVRIQIARGLNAPLTSSMGRLFDAVAALIGICAVNTYEGQAAIELEAQVDPAVDGQYMFDCEHPQIDCSPVIHAVLADVRRGCIASAIAARFHRAVAAMIDRVCDRLAREHHIREIALSGGVFQNVTLLKMTLALLEKRDYVVYLHRLVPPNDGGLALGQAVVAAALTQSIRREG